uniref:Uncharacterized protein n=1 Tax=Oryza meridionalis TaxID=40149 RepID=A0A0E0C065_9ORYZ
MSSQQIKIKIPPLGSPVIPLSPVTLSLSPACALKQAEVNQSVDGGGGAHPGDGLDDLQVVAAPSADGVVGNKQHQDGDGVRVTNLQQQVSRVRPGGEVMHQHEVVRPAGGRHPDGAGVDSKGVGELERGRAEDGVRVRRGTADPARELPHGAGGGLLAAADEAEVAVEPAGLVTEQLGDEVAKISLIDRGMARSSRIGAILVFVRVLQFSVAVQQPSETTSFSVKSNYRAAIWVLDALAKVFPGVEDATEVGKIGRYYASESMLVLDPDTGEYSDEMTPSYGSHTLERVIREGMAGQELGEQTIF